MGKVELVLNKILSGRYFVIVCFTLTLCYLVKIEPSVRDAFFALAGGAVRDYFGRDRSSEKKDEVKPNGTN